VRVHVRRLGLRRFQRMDLLFLLISVCLRRTSTLHIRTRTHTHKYRENGCVENTNNNCGFAAVLKTISWVLLSY
jgi:hypothetical protein